MNEESDEQFVKRMSSTRCDDWCLPEVDRLFALARRGAAVQWKPISEAPQDGTHFLAVIKDERSIRMVAWCKTSHVPLYGWNLVDQGAEDVDFCNPTHWQPLPPPPMSDIPFTADELRKMMNDQDARIVQLEAALRLAKDALADIGVDDVLIAIDAAVGEERTC